MAIPNEPIERKEFYLAKAAGQSVETPEPITREEMYLDAIAEGGGGGGGGSALPEVTASDNGKVLAVVSGEWNKADAPKELPNVTASDNGKVLQVVGGSWNKATPSGSALPSVTSADNGKVLTVVNGAWGKADPKGVTVFEATAETYDDAPVDALYTSATVGAIKSAFDAGPVKFNITLTNMSTELGYSTTQNNIMCDVISVNITYNYDENLDITDCTCEIFISFVSGGGILNFNGFAFATSETELMDEIPEFMAV